VNPLCQRRTRRLRHNSRGGDCDCWWGLERRSHDPARPCSLAILRYDPCPPKSSATWRMPCRAIGPRAVATICERWAPRAQPLQLIRNWPIRLGVGPACSFSFPTALV